MLFGGVRYFTYVDWDTGNKDDKWDGVVRNHERLRCDWTEVGGIEDWGLDPVDPLWVSVVAKKTTERVTGMNNFIALEVYKNFHHIKDKGWEFREF